MACGCVCVDKSVYLQVKACAVSRRGKARPAREQMRSEGWYYYQHKYKHRRGPITYPRKHFGICNRIYLHFLWLELRHNPPVMIPLARRRDTHFQLPLQNLLTTIIPQRPLEQ
jgi:hypothetical protein